MSDKDDTAYWKQKYRMRDIDYRVATNRMLQAEAVLTAVAKPPYKDSNHKSLLETLQAMAVHTLENRRELPHIPSLEVIEELLDLETAVRMYLTTVGEKPALDAELELRQAIACLDHVRKKHP